MTSSVNSTSELLDFLEREMDAPNGNKSSSISTGGGGSDGGGGGGGSNRHLPYRDNGNANDNGGEMRRRQSETSLDSSFTSKLLGGYADVDDDDDVDQSDAQHHHHQPQPQQETTHHHIPSNVIDDHDDNINDRMNPNNYQGNSDTSSYNGNGSQAHSRITAAARGGHQPPQQTQASSFDNPFHSRGSSSNSLNRLMGFNIDNSGGGSKKREGSYSDTGFGHRNISSHHTKVVEAEGNKQVELLQPIRSRLLQGNNTNNDNKHQHSVSFSAEEGWKAYDDNSTTDNGRGDNNSKLVPSSLGSLVSYASTKSSYSGRSSGGGSRSSRSGASTATGSTHSSGSNHSAHAQQERRRRRELTPVKKLGKGSSTKPSRKPSTINTHYSGEMVMLLEEEGGGDVDNGAMVGHRAPTSNRRSRRKKSSAVDNVGGSGGGSKSLLASSRNLYNNRHGGGKKVEGANHGKNLHDRHPVRYPKRGSDEDSDDVDEENGADAIASGGALHLGGDGVDNDDEEEEEEDGFFQRVNKVRNELLHSKSNRSKKSDFLDGLIEATTGQGIGRSESGRRHTNDNGDIVDNIHDNDGAASVGETSFLSDLLTKNSAARQRKAGQSGHRSIDAGGSTTSSVINIYKKNDDGAQQKQQQQQIQQQLHHNAQWLVDSVIKLYEHVMLIIQRSTLRQNLERYYNEGGDILPRNRREVVMMLVWALLVLPLVRVIVIHSMDSDDGYNNMKNLATSFGDIQPSLISEDGSDIVANIWEESSMAMLSKSSTLHENFLLIPDTVWVELQISRNKVQSRGKGNDAIKLPKRLPLPSVIDHEFSSPSSMVLFYVTAVNSTALLLSDNVNANPSKRNMRVNTRLFEAMQERLKPRPIDVWPCWAHNSLAHFREDGLIAMYSATKRKEARVTMKRLAKAFGQSTIYEFITTSDRAKSERRVGSDGSEIIIPGLRNGRSDVMVRRSLSTDAKDKDGAGPAVVMRRVKNLAVEDELTMRDWEGPPLEQVVWVRA